MTKPDARIQETASYADGVRAALGDLEPEHLEVLLEDLEDHLAEIAAESEVPLSERLGPAAEYAAELRAAYGVAEPGGQREARQPAAAWSHAVALTRRAARSAVWLEVLRLAGEFRPAWWLLRAYLPVIAVTLLFGLPGVGRLLPGRRGLLQVVVTLAAMVVSVILGRRARTWKLPARSGMLIANGVLALLALPLLTIASRPNYGPGDQVNFPPDYPGVNSVYAGAPLLNIFPYSSDGKPLHGVLLYDQDGNSVVVDGKGSVVPRSYPTDAAGQPITNAYPLDLLQPDGQPLPAPRVVLPRQPSPSPSATPSPSSSPSP